MGLSNDLFVDPVPVIDGVITAPSDPAMASHSSRKYCGIAACRPFARAFQKARYHFVDLLGRSRTRPTSAANAGIGTYLQTCWPLTTAAVLPGGQAGAAGLAAGGGGGGAATWRRWRWRRSRYPRRRWSWRGRGAGRRSRRRGGRLGWRRWWGELGSRQRGRR